MKKLSEIDVNDILYFVFTDPGAMTNLKNGVVYYFENGVLRGFEGKISEELREIVENNTDAFARITCGLGNYGYVNKRASYLGFDDEVVSRDGALKFKLDGKEYSVNCYCPDTPPPCTDGKEYPMSKYDMKSIWEDWENEGDF